MEPIYDDKGKQISSVLEFWQWAYSDIIGNIERGHFAGECKIVCVKSNCADLFYAPYWGKQLKGWISNGKT